MSLQAVTEEFLGPSVNVRFSDWRGRRWGPVDASVHVRFNSVDALKYFVRSPRELGFGRAYVSGAMDIEGDIFALLDLGRDLGGLRFSPGQIGTLMAEIGVRNLRQPHPVTREDVEIGGRLRAHRRVLDRQAIRHHYDDSNEF